MSVARHGSSTASGRSAIAPSRCYWIGRIVSILSFQMLMVAIGWQLYSHDRQRARSWPHRACAVRADAGADAAGRPCRRPLRLPRHPAGLPERRGDRRGVPGGRLADAAGSIRWRSMWSPPWSAPRAPSRSRPWWRSFRRWCRARWCRRRPPGSPRPTRPARSSARCSAACSTGSALPRSTAPPSGSGRSAPASSP